MKELRLAVVLHEAEEGGYWVSVPSLPGCFSQGEDIEDALRNAKEAIELHLEGLVEDNDQLPDDKELGFTITMQLPITERR